MRRPAATTFAPERQLPEAFGATTEMLWETGPDHRFTQFATLSRADVDGLAHEFDDSSLGRTRWELAGADVEGDAHWAAHKADLEAHRPFENFRYRLIARSGRRRHLSVRGWPVFAASGAFRGYRGTVTDESAIVTALERAHDAETLLRDAVDSISEGFVIYDHDDRLVMCNEAYRRLYGEGADLLIPGTRFEDILRRGIARGLFAEAAADPEAWLAERLRQHRAAETVEQPLSDDRWVLLSERRMRNGGTAGLRVDVTRLKSAEAALRAHEAELSRRQTHLTEAQRLGAIGSYERRFDGTGWDWSREMYHIFGFDPDGGEANDETALARVHPDDRARVLEGRRRLAEGESPHEVEFRIVWPDGEVRTVCNRATPLCDDTGTIVGTFGTVQDVTEKRRVERQLVQAQKMEAVGKLTGGIAHDFNNLLTVILGNSELLLTTVDGPDAELVRECTLAAQRGAELASRLLSYARRQVLQPTAVDVNALVERAVTLMRRTLGENIAIELRLPADGPSVVADAVQLESALINLAINARDAMPDGGRITLEVDALTLEADAATGRELTPGRYVAIALRDTGTGMTQDTLARAFEPFFTTKDVGKGSGLGLSMVYGFAKQSGGHVTIDSTVDGGTVVQLTLPAAAGGVDAPAPTGTPGAPPRGRGETILVVEDNDLVRDMVVRQMRNLGYQVTAAVDGSAAVALLDRGPVDLIFTDVVMPGGMSGFELAEAVRAKAPGTKLLFTSGYSDQAVNAQGRFGAGARLLAKPYEPRELAQHLRALLDAPA